jgi:hypothetical protein
VNRIGLSLLPGGIPLGVARLCRLGAIDESAKVSDTYWYLTGVPDLMAIVGERFELFAATVGADHRG